ncbi:MAG: hypothetical protein K0R54_756 [Clostridiaceae bacterium]|jgi:hypothetical protein|nr:hypothetical protein [Clostridiaceae bacterium]
MNYDKEKISLTINKTMKELETELKSIANQMNSYDKEKELLDKEFSLYMTKLEKLSSEYNILKLNQNSWNLSVKLSSLENTMFTTVARKFLEYFESLDDDEKEKIEGNLKKHDITIYSGKENSYFLNYNVDKTKYTVTEDNPNGADYIMLEMPRNIELLNHLLLD